MLRPSREKIHACYQFTCIIYSFLFWTLRSKVLNCQSQVSRARVLIELAQKTIIEDIGLLLDFGFMIKQNVFLVILDVVLPPQLGNRAKTAARFCLFLFEPLTLLHICDTLY